MCGIWFSAGFTPDPRFIDIVAHRGPDGRGWKEFESGSGPVALGHRRLSIIDTSEAALQPMAYRNARYWLVYNGEIYNYLELRTELEAVGHVFRTRSDSEVLLAAYDQWGESAIERFIGMFAFVIYEPFTQRFFAVRDRFGIKPLYYVNTKHGVAFASEIKQLLRLPGIQASMNVERIYDFLSSGITDHTSETTFAGIRQLRNGEYISANLSTRKHGETFTPFKWYSLPAPGTTHIPEDEAADRFRALLIESIRLQLRSDVTIGSCLSGGLDSSAIVTLIDMELRSQGCPTPLNTVSACYGEKVVDERPFMEAVVSATRTRPHYVFPKAEDALSLAEQITWHQDEPYGSTSIFSQWSVFARAHQEKIKVMLDGQGADEQLSGYHGSFGYYFASLIRRGRYIALVKAMLERKRYHHIPFVRQVRDLLRPILPERVRTFLLRERQVFSHYDWLGSEVFQSRGIPISTFDATLKREGLGPVRNIGELCVALTQALNLPMLLHYEDRNSMAHSVEARVPFLDHRLVEFSIGLGERYKIVGGETKRILRRAMAGIMVDKVCKRQDKLGFATPEEIWFRGPLRPAIEAGIEDTLNRYPALLNPEGTRKLSRDMLDGHRPLDFTLWRIINLGVWGRVFNVTI